MGDSLSYLDNLLLMYNTYLSVSHLMYFIYNKHLTLKTAMPCNHLCITLDQHKQ